jgi:hypothetical protein
VLPMLNASVFRACVAIVAPSIPVGAADDPEGHGRVPGDNAGMPEVARDA